MNRQSFIVRIWLERLDDAPDAVELRAEIRHVGSGDFKYVRDLRSVLSFISQRFDLGAADSTSQVLTWQQLFRRMLRNRPTPSAN